MSVVDDYLATLSDHERSTIGHMYTVIRTVVPDATEEMSYGMPALKYKGKGLVAIMAHQAFLSLYPFCGLDRLGIDFSGFETTAGSLHFTLEQPISDELLRRILTERVRLITA